MEGISLHIKTMQKEVFDILLEISASFSDVDTKKEYRDELFERVDFLKKRIKHACQELEKIEFQYIKEDMPVEVEINETINELDESLRIMETSLDYAKIEETKTEEKEVEDIQSLEQVIKEDLEPKLEEVKIGINEEIHSINSVLEENLNNDNYIEKEEVITEDNTGILDIKEDFQESLRENTDEVEDDIKEAINEILEEQDEDNYSLEEDITEGIIEVLDSLVNENDVEVDDQTIAENVEEIKKIQEIQEIQEIESVKENIDKDISFEIVKEETITANEIKDDIESILKEIRKTEEQEDELGLEYEQISKILNTNTETLVKRPLRTGREYVEDITEDIGNEQEENIEEISEQKLRIKEDIDIEDDIKNEIESIDITSVNHIEKDNEDIRKFVNYNKDGGSKINPKTAPTFDFNNYNLSRGISSEDSISYAKDNVVEPVPIIYSGSSCSSRTAAPKNTSRNTVKQEPGNKLMVIEEDTMLGNKIKNLFSKLKQMLSK